MSNRVMIADTVKIYGKILLGHKVRIADYTIIGASRNENNDMPVIIGNHVIIGSHVTIYKGVKLDDLVYIDDYSLIGENVRIGTNSKILYGAKIYDETQIGENAIIGGSIICERAIIGSYSRIFGDLSHVHREPHLGWDDVVEDSPIIEDHVFIGVGAKVIGGIKIGRCSYVAAGAIVTRDVPSQSIVYGINKIIHYSEWKGKLRDSLFFKICGGR